MCEFNPLNDETAAEASGHQTEPEVSDTAVTADAATEDVAAPTPVRWYGVSYNDEMTPRVTSVKPVKARRTGALIALIVAVCLLFGAVMGLGGYLIAEHLQDKQEQEEDDDGKGGTIIPGATSGGGANTDTAFPMGNAASYDYAAVTIPKNDGSTLVGSQNGSAGDGGKTLIAAIAEVRNSVVEISTETISNRGQLTAGAGSGVIIHADGIIVTNHHVIENVSNIYVRLTNGNTYEAYLRGSDEENDIAILKITPQETLTVARLGCSTALALGEEVFAIGNPLGELGGTVTDGIVSALEREVEMEAGLTMTLIQTNAAINAGNSGGGLFNMAGELIGVVNAKYSATGVEGLGFAIPVDTAILSVNDLLDYGYIKGLPSLGATLVDRTVSNFFYSYTFSYVYEAAAGSALLEGDLIAAVNGTSVSGTVALKRLLRSQYQIGDTVTLTVYHKGENGYNLDAPATVQVTLIEYVPDGSGVSFE